MAVFIKLAEVKLREYSRRLPIFVFIKQVPRIFTESCANIRGDLLAELDRLKVAEVARVPFVIG